MKYFTIKKKKSDAAGKIGQYIKITNDIGVKVIGFRGCKSIDLLMKSINWKKAQDEANWLKLVSSAKLSPKSYGVHPVKFKGRFYAGIFMDHINGTSLNDITNSGSFQRGTKVYVTPRGRLTSNGSGTPIIRYLKQKLHKLGINHFDIHGENVLIDQNQRVWLIDFSADYITRKNKR